MGEPKFRYYAEWEFAGHGRVQGGGPHGGVHGHGQGRDGDGHPDPRPLRRTSDRTDAIQARVSPEELGFEKIVYEKAPPRATITFNRPEILNAFDFQMLRELARACEDASWDDEIRVVVLTGAGRAFCVGADLSSWAEDYLDKPNEYWKWFGAFKDAHDRLREIGKPTVARINGIAVGGGNEFQMACDLAVMVDDAFIRHVGPEHGSVPAGGATQWLTIMVGDRRAREIVLMCEEIPAAKAQEWGLVNRVVPAAELDAEVDRMVENLARKLPQTTRYAKQHLNFWKDLAWHETINHARDWLALSMATEEPKAAIRRSWTRRSELSSSSSSGTARSRSSCSTGPDALNALSDELMERARRDARGARPRRGDALHRPGRQRQGLRRRRGHRASSRARRRSTSTTSGASSAGTRSAGSGRRSSPRSPATASAAAASWPWPAT